MSTKFTTYYDVQMPTLIMPADAHLEQCPAPKQGSDAVQPTPVQDPQSSFILLVFFIYAGSLFLCLWSLCGSLFLLVILFLSMSLCVSFLLLFLSFTCFPSFLFG